MFQIRFAVKQTIDSERIICLFVEQSMTGDQKIGVKLPFCWVDMSLELQRMLRLAIQSLCPAMNTKTVSKYEMIPCRQKCSNHQNPIRRCMHLFFEITHNPCTKPHILSNHRLEEPYRLVLASIGSMSVYKRPPFHLLAAHILHGTFSFDTRTFP